MGNLDTTEPIRSRLIRAALDCFLADDYHRVTTRLIAEAAGANASMIRYYFGNKEGLVAALFFTALDDQASLRERYLAQATTAQEGVYALVHSYVDWVDSQPDWARFQFHARFAVTKGPLKDELVARNKSRNRQLLEWLAAPGRGDELQRVPAELMPSLIIGQAESYCRAWLSGRVQSSPKTYRDVLAEAAWRSIGGE